MIIVRSNCRSAVIHFRGAHMRIRLLTTTASLAMTVLAGVALAQAQEPPVTEVAPITVSATRTATRVDDAPATVSVITDREIEANLYTDIKDLVRFEPGVSVPSQPARFGAALGTTGRAGNEGFTIRGLGGDHGGIRRIALEQVG